MRTKWKVTPLHQGIIESVKLSLHSDLDRLPQHDPSTVRLKERMFKKLAVTADNEKLLKEEALARFLNDEKTNRETNLNWRANFYRGTLKAPDRFFWSDVQREILRILGYEPNLERVLTLSRFGPGATFTVKRKASHSSDKFSKTDVTRGFSSIAAETIRSAYPTWARYLTDADQCTPLLEAVPGSKFSTVFKDQASRRTILIEPTINSWFQQGFGRHARERFLKSTGIDLNDQSRNQALALFASVFGVLATLDLKSASNLVCTEPLRFLLPIKWFTALDIVRSHRCRIGKDSWHELEMFSSMGNGFTFDLMSIVLYAIGKIACDRAGTGFDQLSVFGDDVILPTAAVDVFVDALETFGMRVNADKSFVWGPFRESCGLDAWYGRVVTPFYVRRLDDTMDLVKLHNRIREWTEREGGGFAATLGLLRSVLCYVPIIPSHLGDAGLHGSFDEVCPPLNPYGWEDSYLITTLQPVFGQRERNDRWLNLSRISQLSDFARNSIIEREEPKVFRYVKSYSRW